MKMLQECHNTISSNKIRTIKVLAGKPARTLKIIAGAVLCKNAYRLHESGSQDLDAAALETFYRLFRRIRIVKREVLGNGNVHRTVMDAVGTAGTWNGSTGVDDAGSSRKADREERVSLISAHAGCTTEQQPRQGGVGLYQHGRVPDFLQQQISGMDTQTEQVNIDNRGLRRDHRRIGVVVKGDQ